MPNTVNIYCVTSLDRGLLRAILAVQKSGAILDGVDFLLVLLLSNTINCLFMRFIAWLTEVQLIWHA